MSGRDYIYYPSKAERAERFLTFYDVSDRKLADVELKKVSDIWYCNNTVTFISREKPSYGGPETCIHLGNADVRAVIELYLQNINGKSPPTEAQHLDFLLWEHKPLHGNAVRVRIREFVFARSFFYFDFVWAALLFYGYGKCRWIGLGFIPLLFFTLLNLIGATGGARDLKRLGITPRWFSKTVTPNTGKRSRKEAKP